MIAYSRQTIYHKSTKCWGKKTKWKKWTLTWTSRMFITNGIQHQLRDVSPKSLDTFIWKKNLTSLLRIHRWPQNFGTKALFVVVLKEKQFLIRDAERKIKPQYQATSSFIKNNLTDSVQEHLLFPILCRQGPWITESLVNSQLSLLV